MNSTSGTTCTHADMTPLAAFESVAAMDEGAPGETLVTVADVPAVGVTTTLDLRKVHQAHHRSASRSTRLTGQQDRDPYSYQPQRPSSPPLESSQSRLPQMSPWRHQSSRKWWLESRSSWASPRHPRLDRIQPRKQSLSPHRLRSAESEGVSALFQSGGDGRDGDGPCIPPGYIATVCRLGIRSRRSTRCRSVRT